MSGHASERKLEALRCFSYLANRNRERFVWSSVFWLSQRLACSARWARKIVEELERDKWIIPCVAHGRRGWRVFTHKEWGNGRPECSFFGKAVLPPSGTPLPQKGTPLPQKGTPLPLSEAGSSTKSSDSLGVTRSAPGPRNVVGESEERVEGGAFLLWRSLGFEEPTGNRRLRRAVEEKAASARWKSGLGKVVGVAEVGEAERVGLWAEIREEFDARREPIPHVVLDAIEECLHRLQEMRDSEDEKFEPPPMILTPGYQAEQGRKHRKLLASVFERVHDENGSEEDEFKPPPFMVEPIKYERKT